MKQSYVEFISAMIDKKRDDGRYKHWPMLPTDREVVRGECGSFSKQMVEAFPHLTLVRGFYVTKDAFGDECPNEHWWTVDVDGTIVDPTRAQFGDQGGRYSPYEDREFKCIEGKCPNCGIEFYEGEGVGGLCSDECCESYAAYIDRECKRNSSHF